MEEVNNLAWCRAKAWMLPCTLDDNIEETERHSYHHLTNHVIHASTTDSKRTFCLIYVAWFRKSVKYVDNVAGDLMKRTLAIFAIGKKFARPMIRASKVLKSQLDCDLISFGIVPNRYQFGTGQKSNNRGFGELELSSWYRWMVTGRLHRPSVVATESCDKQLQTDVSIFS